MLASDRDQMLLERLNRHPHLLRVRPNRHAAWYALPKRPMIIFRDAVDNREHVGNGHFGKRLCTNRWNHVLFQYPLDVAGVAIARLGDFGLGNNFRRIQAEHGSRYQNKKPAFTRA